MSDTVQAREDEVLRRMLNTPHEKHKPLRERREKEAGSVESEPKEKQAG